MKVMVVDDNAIVRLGLQSVLQRIEAVHEVIAADSAFSALEAHHAHSPDIILLDISMPPGRSGLEILPELARDASVIMLTSNRDPSSIREALDAGARGYLVHGQLGVNEVAGAIETCRSGGLVLGREAADVILNPSTEDLTDNPLRAQVSDREAEILDLSQDPGPQPCGGDRRLAVTTTYPPVGQRTGRTPLPGGARDPLPYRSSQT